MVRAFLLLALTVIGAHPVDAQQSNAERMGALAVECAAEALAEADSVALSGPDRLPFLRSAIVTDWQTRGRAVFVPDSPAAQGNLRLRLDQAGVTYIPVDGQVRRTVSLSLHMEHIEANGRVAVDTRCVRSSEDLVPKSGLSSLEDPSYPETQGAHPPPGWFRRVLQPAMIVTASAIGTFLFFSLRSSRTDDG